MFKIFVIEGLHVVLGLLAIADQVKYKIYPETKAAWRSPEDGFAWNIQTIN